MLWLNNHVSGHENTEGVLEKGAAGFQGNGPYDSEVSKTQQVTQEHQLWSQNAEPGTSAGPAAVTQTSTEYTVRSGAVL